MKKALFLTALSVITACSTQAVEKPSFGADRDMHNCIASAGQSWSQLRQECVQVFDVADIRLSDPDNKTLAIYAILSPDKQQAEVFKADFNAPQIFDVVKGGYVSKDRSMRLLKTQSGWAFKRK